MERGECAHPDLKDWEGNHLVILSKQELDTLLFRTKVGVKEGYVQPESPKQKVSLLPSSPMNRPPSSVKRAVDKVRGSNLASGIRSGPRTLEFPVPVYVPEIILSSQSKAPIVTIATATIVPSSQSVP